MNCPKCRMEIALGEKFCQHCGTSLQAVPPSVAKAATAQVANTQTTIPAPETPSAGGVPPSLATPFRHPTASFTLLWLRKEYRCGEQENFRFRLTNHEEKDLRKIMLAAETKAYRQVKERSYLDVGVVWDQAFPFVPDTPGKGWCVDVVVTVIDGCEDARVYRGQQEFVVRKDAVDAAGSPREVHIHTHYNASDRGVIDGGDVRIQGLEGLAPAVKPESLEASPVWEPVQLFFDYDASRSLVEQQAAEKAAVEGVACEKAEGGRREAEWVAADKDKAAQHACEAEARGGEQAEKERRDLLESKRKEACESPAENDARKVATDPTQAPSSSRPPTPQVPFPQAKAGAQELPIPVPSPTTQQLPRTERTPEPAPKKSYGLKIGIAAVAAVVLGIGGFIMTRTPSPPNPPGGQEVRQLGGDAGPGADKAGQVVVRPEELIKSGRSGGGSGTIIGKRGPVEDPPGTGNDKSEAGDNPGGGSSGGGGNRTQPPAPVAEIPLEIMVNFVGQRETSPNAYQAIDIRDGATLRSNDNFKILVRASRECYLYVINFDSTGKANLLFPGMAGSNNKIGSSNDYQIPDGDNWMFLDNNTGTEAFYVIADVRPMSDLQGLVAEMERQGGRDTSKQILAQVRTRGVSVKQIVQGSARTFRTGDGDVINNVTQVVRGTGSLVWSLSFKHI